MPGAWLLETDLCKEQADLKGQFSKHISGRGKGQKKKGHWQLDGEREKEKFGVMQDKTEPQNWRA